MGSRKLRSTPLPSAAVQDPSEAASLRRRMSHDTDAEPMTTTDPAPSVRPRPALDEHVQQHLGELLKASYEDLVSQPVPEDIKRLLEELERSEGRK